MKRNVISGIVKKVEPVHKWLTFVTLDPIDDVGWAEARLPLYIDFRREKDQMRIVGRPVDIVTTYDGFLGRRITQEISTSNFSSMSGPFSKAQIDAIINSYEETHNLSH